jgi:hypothetical protein
MQALISNYENGNLTDAKAQARRHSFTSILTALREAGYSPAKCIAVTAYLKGCGSFQAAADTE